MRRATLVALALLLASPPAHAFCFPPTEPFGGPPSAPYCSISGTGYNRCSSWQIESFRSEVEDYIDQMQRYLDDAQAYAECSVDEAVGAWNDFVAGY